MKTHMKFTITNGEVSYVSMKIGSKVRVGEKVFFLKYYVLSNEYNTSFYSKTFR